jgi:RHS repeat-associated protein
MAELNATNQPVRSYAWGLDLGGTLEAAGGVGGLLALTDAATGLQYLPTYDSNGNLTGLINATDSSSAAQYDAGPFAEPLRTTGPMASANPFRFSTKYTDDETGLCYYGYRYYQAQTGRWLSADPIQEAGGENIYAGVVNNPINFIDSVGLQAWIICNRCSNNPHGPMTCIIYDDTDRSGRSSQPYTANEYRNDPLVPADVVYDVKPKPKNDMYPENRDIGPRNVAHGKVKALPNQKYPNPRAEFPEGTPSITLPGLPAGQINPARPNLNNHRIHGPGDSLGCHTTGNCGTIQDMMNRNMAHGGTTYTIHEVKCDCRDGKFAAPPAPVPIRRAKPAYAWGR